MSDLPRLSVIIINWNAADETMKSVRSTLAQDYDDLEIVLVDNGSTDGSVAQLRALDLPRLRLVISADNTGFAGGVAAALATIDQQPDPQRPERLILLLNNDATLMPGALGAMVACLDADPQVGLVGGTILNEHDDGVQFIGGGHVHPITGSSQRRAGHGTPDFISGALMLMRAQIPAAIGGFDPRYFMYWEDVDFSRRARAAGWRLAVAEDAVARHKAMGSTGADSPTYDYHFTRSAALFFRRQPLPLAVIAGKKLVKRLIRGPRANARAVLRGLRDGWRAG